MLDTYSDKMATEEVLLEKWRDYCNEHINIFFHPYRVAKNYYYHAKTGTVLTEKDIEDYISKDTPLNLYNILDFEKVRSKYNISELKGEEHLLLAEARRYKFLSDSSVKEKTKRKILDMGNFIKDKMFWLNNIDIENNLFIAENIVTEYMLLYNLRTKHYDTLARTNPLSKKEEAKKEILKQIEKNTFFMEEICFPNFNPYQIFHDREIQKSTRIKR